MHRYPDIRSKQILNAEKRKLSEQTFVRPALHQIQWKRIVLDEAHNVLFFLLSYYISAIY
jgi:SNF2 family DNA or RNA helicase